MAEVLEVCWPVAVLVSSIVAAAHAMLNKREVRSAAAWVGLIFLVPVLGTLLYVLLGINRIRRAAQLMRISTAQHEHRVPERIEADEIARRLSDEHAHLAGIARTIERTSRRALLPGNRVTPLRDGDEGLS